MENHLVIANRHIRNATYFESPASLELYLSQHPEIVKLLFVFWSHIVSKEMLEKYVCIGFHTGPLLEGCGKGGSPIDNLKALGVVWTTLCAFDMVEEIDGGRVRLAVPINISFAKSRIVEFIDGMLPYMVAYLTAVQPPIPVTFKRIKNV